MWNPDSYTMAALLLPRLLGFVYLFAIGAFLFQIRGLIGENGILPLKDYLYHLKNYYSSKRFLYVPSVFWLSATDRALMSVIWLGTGLSIALILGIYPPLCLGLLYLIYLSITSAGQDFLQFGWESFLLETTFYTFWMSLTPVPNLMIWICLNLLLFRFHFQAGAVKLQSRDQSWRHLTALAFHYQTQPLPNTQAWYVYKWPLTFHKFSAVLMFAIELIFPFGLLFGEEIRAGVGAAFIGLQVMIWATGNFSYLNYLTSALSIIAFSNSFLGVPFAPSLPSSNKFLTILLSFVGAIFILLQLVQLWHHFWPKRRLARWLYSLYPYHLVNPYGIFAVMTTERYEIIIEGSHDGHDWQEYLCRYKPSEITRRPRRIAPYQPRIDWQMWFLPFDDFEAQTWFHQFLYHILKGTPEVLKLMRYNPFAEKPPKYVRAVMYDYKFSSYQEKKEQGWWWKRSWMGNYSPVMMLKEKKVS